MQFVRTDSGMSVSGLSEDNDCAVRAYAVFKNIPYSEAHALFKKHGRVDRRGTFNHIIFSILGTGQRKYGDGITLNGLIQKHPLGKIYAMKREHAFAIKDGVLYDTWKVGGKSRIKWYWVDDSTTSILALTPPSLSKSEQARTLIAAQLSVDNSLSLYAVAKQVAAQMDITVANAHYYARKYFGTR